MSSVGDLGVRHARGRSAGRPRARAAVSSSISGAGAAGARDAAFDGELLDQPLGDRRARAAPRRARRRGRRTTSCSGGTSLSRKPLAPAAQRVVDVLVEVEGREHEHARRRLVTPMASTRRVASMPSMRGMRMSMSTTSGLRRSTASTACTPSSASPTTSRSASASRIMLEAGADQRLVVGDQQPDGRAVRRLTRSPWRARRRSGKRARTSKPPPRRRPVGHPAAVERGALAHADEAVAAAGDGGAPGPWPSSPITSRSSSSPQVTSDLRRARARRA